MHARSWRGEREENISDGMNEPSSAKKKKEKKKKSDFFEEREE
jgi:hypothetical protein